MTWEELIKKYNDNIYDDCIVLYFNENELKYILCTVDGRLHICSMQSDSAATIIFRDMSYDNMDKVISGLIG